MDNIKKYVGSKIQECCRICLEQPGLGNHNETFGLESPFALDDSNQEVLTYEALELVMFENVALGEKYPSVLCSICYQFLKIAYDLKIQYQASKKKLQAILKINQEQSKEKESQHVYSIKNINRNPKEKGKRNLVGLFLENSFNKKEQIESKEILKEAPFESQEENDNQHHSEKDYNSENENIEYVYEVETMDDKEVTQIAEQTQFLNDEIFTSQEQEIKKGNSEDDNEHLESQCTICDKSFRLKKYLYQHMRNTHKENTAKKKSKQSTFECESCHKVFDDGRKYKYHVVKHGAKEFSCSECQKKFWTKNELRIHKECHNKGKLTKVVCPICGKGFHYQTGLFYHMKTHTDKRDYYCKFCPKKFYMLNSLKRHERTHTDERPYPCKYCDKKFRSLGEAKTHHYLHTGERPYNCEVCRKGFTQSYNLNVHLTTHPGEYGCHICDKGFINLKILRFHLLHKHRIKTDEDDTEIKNEDIGVADDEHFILEIDDNGDQCAVIDQYEDNPALVETHENEEKSNYEILVAEEDFEDISDNLFVKTYDVQNEEIMVESN